MTITPSNIRASPRLLALKKPILLGRVWKYGPREPSKRRDCQFLDVPQGWTARPHLPGGKVEVASAAARKRPSFRAFFCAIFPFMSGKTDTANKEYATTVSPGNWQGSKQEITLLVWLGVLWDCVWSFLMLWFSLSPDWLESRCDDLLNEKAQHSFGSTLPEGEGRATLRVHDWETTLKAATFTVQQLCWLLEVTELPSLDVQW